MSHKCELWWVIPFWIRDISVRKFCVSLGCMNSFAQQVISHRTRLSPRLLAGQSEADLLPPQAVTRASLVWLVLHQIRGQQTVSVKGHRLNILGTTGQTVCVTTTQLCNHSKRSHKTEGEDLKGAVFQQNLIPDAKTWISCNFTITKYLFYKNSCKIKVSFLAHRLQKTATGLTKINF